MRRKILASFAVLLFLLALGGLAASRYVTMAADDLETLLGLHRVEHLRRALVIDVQSVQADLHALNTPRARDLNQIVDHVARLEGSARECRSCHHPPELSQALVELGSRIQDYQDALSFYITARANRERIERIQLRAASIGDELLRSGEQMSQRASERLDRMTQQATARIHNVRPILLGTGIAGLLVGLAVALHLAGAVARPVRRLVEATRALAAGEVGRTVAAEGTPEFGELAHNFNAMSLALQEHYERLREANVELEAEIAERRRTEEALMRDEVRLRAMLELSRMVDASAREVAEFVLDRALHLTQSPEGFVSLVEDGRRRLVHCAHRSSAGRLLESPCEGTPPEDAPWARALRSGEALFANRPGTGPRLLAVPLVEKEHVVGLAVVAGKAEEYGEADAQHVTLLVHGLWQQVTRRRTEEELLRAQKLESIGVLAGGIAHDFNNLLTGILANVSLVEAQPETGPRAHQRLEEVEKACRRAQALTQQLLTFAKGGGPLKRAARLGELVRESATFALSGSAAACEVQVAPDLWLTEVDPGQVGQVISNLVINAAQAMPPGGAVRVACDNVGAPTEDAPSLTGGRYVRISVADQGCGIPAADLPRIFDPYFTTKPGGSGLGLATAYSVVRRHGGHLTVQSEPGAGTTFRVYLPASVPGGTPAAEGEPAPQTAADRPEPSGPARILVMDDDDLIRDAAAEILGEAGYSVAAVPDGRAAVELYRDALAAGDPFAAVVLDLTVPGGMGGLATLARLRELDPGVRAVVSSGYSNDPALAEYGRFGFRARITKPYRMAEFLATLAEVLRAEG